VRFLLNGRRGHEVFVPLLGRHTATNALAAIAVARKLRLSEEAIIDSLSRAAGPGMRLELSSVNGLTLLNDAYNANPTSTRAAIETLAALPARGRRVAVLGDMLELGSRSDEYHMETGQLAAGSKLDLLICVGKKAKLIATSAKKAGMEAPRIVTYPNALSAARGILRRIRTSDTVLLKGSRAIGLEAIAKAIEEREHHFSRKAS
jgi:UDP-N-acetylmuramoyl-tripeptide--D-alanyl-D-alanine ligase